MPFVFNSPHSGRQYPQSLLDHSPFTPLQLRCTEDAYVDMLFENVVAMGAPLLCANFPRVWLDVNRETYELDPLLFRERLPAHANTRSPRVAAGLGIVPRLISENRPIYTTPPTLREAADRITRIYRPYHDMIRRLMGVTLADFGRAVLVDCHSMPSNAPRPREAARPDIVIGDRYGTSCNAAIHRELVMAFTDLGYSVARNAPYAGGFITEHYGRPAKGFHAVQIEINRGLYLNERTLEPLDGFVALQQDLNQVVERLLKTDVPGLSQHPQAAQ